MMISILFAKKEIAKPLSAPLCKASAASDPKTLFVSGYGGIFIRSRVTRPQFSLFTSVIVYKHDE